MLRKGHPFLFCRNEIEDGCAILNRGAPTPASESHLAKSADLLIDLPSTSFQSFLINDTIDLLCSWLFFCLTRNK